jgi:exodeoxyribonuclease VII small subunit
MTEGLTMEEDPTMSDTPKPEGFDQVLAGLRGVVERLEGGNLSLEQSLAAFEEGVRLSRRGAEILDAAESRIEILLKEPNADVKAVPFEAAERGGR